MLSMKLQEHPVGVIVKEAQSKPEVEQRWEEFLLHAISKEVNLHEQFLGIRVSVSISYTIANPV